MPSCRGSPDLARKGRSVPDLREQLPRMNSSENTSRTRSETRNLSCRISGMFRPARTRPTTESMTSPTVSRSDLPDQGYRLIHVDPSLIVADKASGLLSVPGRGADKQDCLSRRLQADYPDALIVHRLDFDTSGLLVLARGKEMHRRLSILFQSRQVEKRYVAVVRGILARSSGEIRLPLIVDWPNRPRHKVDFVSGKPSLTLYRVLSHDARTQCSRLELTPATGRTHQLRVHLQALGHPILGDTLYNDTVSLGNTQRLLLHAEFLAFAHPESGDYLQFRSPAPF